LALADPLAIVHIVAPGEVGGTESVIRGLAIGHHRQGHQVHVIGVVELEPQVHPYLRSLSDAGVRVHALHLGTRAYLQERRIVRRMLEETRPDVVHTHGYRPDILDAPLARALGIATVTTLHGSSLLGGRAALHEWLQMRLLSRSEAVVAVSRQIVEDLKKTRVPPDRVYYIPNGWVASVEPLPRSEARKELGLAATGTVVGWVARLIPVKSCDNFLRAFSACRGLPVQAAIIGDGAERTRLEALCAELAIADQVTFCGARGQAGRLFAAFDAFVLSSRSEGTPITLLEAMAAGVPVVTTAVGGIPDVVTPNEALLVPAEDSVALGTAICQVINDPVAARVRAEAATRRLNGEFSAERWLASHETMYRAIRKTR
jgi:glycosyltransferase involved in cell wall biosynthesis